MIHSYGLPKVHNIFVISFSQLTKLTGFFVSFTETQSVKRKISLFLCCELSAIRDKEKNISYVRVFTSFIHDKAIFPGDKSGRNSFCRKAWSECATKGFSNSSSYKCQRIESYYFTLHSSLNYFGFSDIFGFLNIKIAVTSTSYYTYYVSWQRNINNFTFEHSSYLKISKTLTSSKIWSRSRKSKPTRQVLNSLHTINYIISKSINPDLIMYYLYALKMNFFFKKSYMSRSWSSMQRLDYLRIYLFFFFHISVTFIQTFSSFLKIKNHPAWPLMILNWIFYEGE